MQLIGHRGAAGEAPENTLAGFARARELGLTGFELDVCLSADGVLVVLHDDTVDRTTNGHGPASALTVAELRALDARAIFPDWPEPVGIPTLAEVLAGFPDFAVYQLEIKHHEPRLYPEVCRQLAEAVEQNGLGERALAISFDPAALAALREVAPRIRRGLLTGRAEPADLETATALQCAWVSMNVPAASAEAARAVRARGMRVCTWTCNTAEDLDTALAWEAEAVVTDVPTLLREWLKARGVEEE